MRQRNLPSEWANEDPAAIQSAFYHLDRQDQELAQQMRRKAK